MTKAEMVRIRAEEQVDFCSRLMDRLHQDFLRDENMAKTFTWLVIANKTQLLADIKRIRRELGELSKMLDRDVME